MYGQPIVPLMQDRSFPIRYELLLRLLDDNDELVMPGAFIPPAERYGLMGIIDRWVIRTAFRHYTENLNTGNSEIAINLSANSLSDDSLLEFVQTQFVEFGFPPERVCFEITESAAMQNLSKAAEFMKTIRKCGSHLALDDFGSGLASFRYLDTLPIDYLKIDGSVVQDMLENTSSCAMVAAINQVGHTMSMQTIAEYAHRQAIVERLRELGVDYAQGYAVGSPVPWSEVQGMTSNTAC